MQKHSAHLYINANSYNIALLWEDKYMFCGDHQKKIQQAPEGSRFPVTHCGAPTLSGQPRFSKSHALITPPSVKIVPKEGVASELGWHTFSRWGRGWGEPKRAARLHAAHSVMRLFYIEPSVSLKNYHKGSTYTITMNLCKNLLRSLRTCVQERRGEREDERQSLNLFILAHLSPHNKPPRTCNWL